MTMEDSDRDERTIFVGGLPEKTTEALLYELFFQAGELIIFEKQKVQLYVK